MKESACQREFALMLDKKELAYALMDRCYGCGMAIIDRPVMCRRDNCHVCKALEISGYTIPLMNMWEGEDETAESLAASCQSMDCPCAELLYVNGQCPLGALEVTGLCRLHAVEDWENALQKDHHKSNL